MPKEITLINCSIVIDDMKQDPAGRAAGIYRKIIFIEGDEAFVIPLTEDACRTVADGLRPSGIVITQPNGVLQ